jgi:predicted DNA-binding protein
MVKDLEGSAKCPPMPRNNATYIGDTVMCSVFLGTKQDARLRQLAHELGVTKSELIRAAVEDKLRDWLTKNKDVILNELNLVRSK